MAGELRVAMVGTGFMGKAHSNGWSQASHFFDLKLKPVLSVLCDINTASAEQMAKTWGWREIASDWKKVVQRDDVDLVDICTPNNTHAEIAIGALKAGKHVTCEKPIAMNVEEALAMAKAAKAAKDRVNLVNFSYRRCPALAFARKLVQEGRLGRIYHVRCVYLQSWIMDPNFPLVWRLQGKVAGSGPHGDLNAHIIDAARFVTGEEITEVSAEMETFIKERPLLASTTGGLGAQAGKQMGKVTVEDAVVMLARLSGGGLGTFEATRFGQGRKNYNCIEINGAKGALKFEFEDMNRLKFYDATQPNELQGWTDIMVTEPQHPYIKVYWPAGHIIGYEHSFINMAADVATAIAEGKAAQAAPDFADSAKTQMVLDAALVSAKERAWVKTKC